MADIYITKKTDKGTVNISEEVISNIIRGSITDVEGVASISNTAGAEIADFIGLKSFFRGVKIQNEDEKLTVDTIINIKYGYNIVEVAEKVQKSIVSSLLSAAGIDNPEINVHVAGISFQ